MVFGSGEAVLVTKKNIVGYAFLPGILPRLRQLVFSHMATLTFLVASTLYTFRLLPRTHPCFQPGNTKPVTLRGVMAEAASRLELNSKNIDQIIIFGAILCGIVMLGLYMVGLFFMVFFSTANAAGLFSLFQTTYPQKDIAFMMLDKVFGIPGLYQSEVSTNAAVYGAFPNAYHNATRQLFSFFSWGIFILAVIMFLFHVVQMVYTVTQTGKALDAVSDGDQGSHNFGWLPLRFLVALGLLIPVSYGLNSAQWITLYMAKWGSSLATNAWIQYNSMSGTNPIGESNENLVAAANLPDNTGVIKNLLLIKACQRVNNIAQNWLSSPDGDKGPYLINAFLVKGKDRLALLKYGGQPTSLISSIDQYNSTPSGIINGSASDAFATALNFAGLSDIHITIGYFDATAPDRFKEYEGGVLPVCGEIIIPVTSFTGEGIFAAEAYFYATFNIVANVTRQGKTLSNFEQNSDLAVIREYMRTSSLARLYMTDTAAGAGYTGNPDCPFDSDGDNYQSLNSDPGIYLGKCKDPVPSLYWQELINKNDYYTYAFDMAGISAYDFLAGTNYGPSYSPFHSIGSTSYDALGQANPFSMTVQVMKHGWGGAGLWYNKISERNGSLYSAVNNPPKVSKLPMVMNEISTERVKNDSKVGGKYCEKFNPRRAGTSEANTGAQNNQFSAEAASSYYALCNQLFHNENVVDPVVSNPTTYNNPVLGAMAGLFSQIKAFDLYRNNSVTPMVQLSAIGRLLIDKAILNLIVATGSSFAGGLAHMAGGGATGANALGHAGGAVAKAAIEFAVIGLTAGVVLHYVLPFLPFLYFFFAVGAWVKTIFEAMVGTPLWALAHLRSGGPGLPGDAAASGYFLILEIFLRPIVTVISLIAAFGCFSALAAGLNGIFALLVTNVMGGNIDTTNAFEMGSIRGLADQFFLTILYIIIVYMLATSCFKLIDLIPDNVMRWSGAGVSSFGKTDASERLVDMLQYQIPIAVQSQTRAFGRVITDTLYEPARKWGEGKELARKVAEKQAAEAKKAAPQRSADKQSQEALTEKIQGAGGGSENP